MANTNRLLDASGRSPEEAKENIYTCTQKENTSKTVILADLSQRFADKRFTITDHGCDNSGKYIENPNRDPDWQINIDDRSVLCEVLVHSEKSSACSNKVPKLKKAVETNAITIIVRESYWLLITAASAQWMLDNLEYSNVAKVNGGKDSIILSHVKLQTLVNNGKILKYDYLSDARTVMGRVIHELFGR